MDAVEFAARRRESFVKVDKELLPSTERALQMFARGESNWREELIDDASVLWLEIFQSEAPYADPDRFLARFRESVGESLDQTATPDDPPDDAQIERVAKWLGTYTVNDATYQGAGARGVRYKRWVTMHDNAVRDTHVVADGQTVRIGAPFDVGGYDLRFPGDPVGPPAIWINCRCVVQPADVRGAANVSPTTFAMDEVVDEVDEDLPVDELEDDEEEVTEIPVHGVLAPEGVPTGDGRQFGEGALTNRELPLPIAYQLMSGEGHNGSVTVGRIDEVFRAGNEMRFRGALVLTKEHTASVVEGIIDGTVRGISVDVDDVEVDMSIEDGESMDGKMPLMVFSHARIAGVTIVPIPAFQEAFIGLGHEFADELDEETLAACAACAEEGPEDEENPDVELGYDAFKDYTAEERKRMAESGEALPDGSFPIANEQDLRNAIQAIGRASDPAAARAHIKKRARALGHPELIPEGWSIHDGMIVDLSGLPDYEVEAYHALNPEEQDAYAEDMGLIIASGAFAPGTKDGPGWITHPIPTARIRRYWVHGKGAAKIRWGVPGDFNRCRRQLGKYVKRPDWLAGLCANMHYEALGFWPGRPLSAITASGAPAPIFNMVAAAAKVFPAEKFARQDLEDPRVGIVVEGDHVFGYMAQWGVCHIGITGVCTETPHSNTDYWYYATGIVDTTEGPIHVGQITMDTGHAPLRANAKVAAAHYDNTGAAVADVAVGEDAYGIWFSGVLRPTITDDQLHALRASGRISGDWRTIGGNLEMVAGLVVNVPGLPIPHTLAASANGEQVALVAAGIVPPAEPVVTFSNEFDAEKIAAIVRTAVDEYRHAEKKEVRVTPIRAALRDKQVAALRERLKGN